MIDVVIADDSAFMRKLLSNLFAAQPDFNVVGTASNGKDAVAMAKSQKPNLLVLDVNMPVMNGLQALEIIMKECPLPVLIFSSAIKNGAEESIKALSLGAVDVMPKDGGSISVIDRIADDILRRCRKAANTRIARRTPCFNFNSEISSKKQEVDDFNRINILDRAKVPSRISSILGNGVQGSKVEELRSRGAKTGNDTLQNMYLSNNKSRLVAIGTSTGGPRALQTVIPSLPADLPCGVVLVQHMPPGFTKSLADRLNEISKVTVKEAEDCDIIKPGCVYIAPGDYHMTVRGEGAVREISLNRNPPLGNHRPAVDVLFDSVVKYGRDVVSVILTGMGCDGAAGMKKIKKAGGYVIAESSDTCVVYGMPKAVVDSGIADEVLPVQQVAGAIVRAVKI